MKEIRNIKGENVRTERAAGGLKTNQALEGKSAYGVWGALGSINGHETVSL